MQRKSRASFANHDEWLVYVRRELPCDEQTYVLAFGRTELLLSFLEVRNQSLPAELKAELDLILGLPDPDRADRLDTLNDRIMAHLIEMLFAEAGPTLDQEKHTRRLTPRQQTQELLDHLASRNPYFRLWIDYKGRAGGEFNERAWIDFLRRQLGEDDADSLDFAKEWRSWIGFLSGSMTRIFRCLASSLSALGSFISCVNQKEWLRRAPFLSTLVAEIPPCMCA